ncbi:hypothetical protein IFU40_06055 [Microbacterium sp. CFBP 13617]|uniref:hypothetical protein n=1 Tax=Microbacterium sp. CFBP 13617 TaxID=2774035 RepID=UPI00177F4028|nr:hypothetical protein [Microbacterium sp. CFBP 13617]MBD8218195.1 hypothetical protein [Microbacterium sp. CFBP 13617]
MRPAQDTTRQLIRDLADGRGGFGVEWTADLMYDGDRRLRGLDIGEPSISWDLGRFTVASGSVPVVWSDAFGTSMIPKEIGDWFSPFGAELQVDVLIRAGEYVDRIPMARLVIESVPAAEDRRMLFQGVAFTPGESFTVNVSDRMVKVARDEFRVPTAATSRSAWGEIQSVTRFPIVRSSTDATVPAAMAYEGKKEDVVSKLFDLMGQWPHLTADGVLTGMPKAWGSPVDRVRGVVSSPIEMTAENTYNCVIVEGKDDAGAPIYAIAEVQDGFLRVANPGGGMSPFGVKPFRYASEFLRSYQQCADYAVELLERVSRLRGVTREVVEPFNPLREVGDVLTFDGGPVRITKLTHSGAETKYTVEVPDQ